MGTAAITGLLYQPRMIGDGDCGEIGGSSGGSVVVKALCCKPEGRGFKSR
jgi:hypothetical protein